MPHRNTPCVKRRVS